MRILPGSVRISVGWSARGARRGPHHAPVSAWAPTAGPSHSTGRPRDEGAHAANCVPEVAKRLPGAQCDLVVGHEPVPDLFVVRLDPRLDDLLDRDITVIGAELKPERPQLRVHQVGSERALREVLAVGDRVPVALHRTFVIPLGHWRT